MNFVKKFYIQDDVVNGGGDNANQETPEERAIRLEAELNAEREKIKNQNSYITKLEAERNKQQTTAPKVTPQAQTTQPQVSQSSSARDPYLVELQTKDVVNNGLEEIRKEVGDVIYEEIKEDVVRIARANIKDPGNVPEGLFGRVAEMALGRAMKDEAKRVKIAGAYITPSQPTTPETKTVVVNNPNLEKIGTMQPGDKQGLGTQATPPPGSEATKRSPREFFKDLRSKK